MKLERENAPWSDKEELFLQHWFKNGKSISELAKRHKRTEYVICSKLQIFGLITTPKIIVKNKTNNTVVLLQPEKNYLGEDIINSDTHSNLSKQYFDKTERKNGQDSDESESDLEKANSLINLSAYYRYTPKSPNAEDWSDIFDDLDTGDWENILFESYYYLMQIMETEENKNFDYENMDYYNES